jgi:hypothetical protein
MLQLESLGAQISESLSRLRPAKTENYRPDFSSERATHIKKPLNFLKIIKVRRGKIGRGSQMGA